MWYWSIEGVKRYWADNTWSTDRPTDLPTDRHTDRHTDRPTVAKQYAPFFKRGIKIMYFHYMTYMAWRPSTRTSAPGVMKGRPFLGNHYFIHNLSNLCLGVKKKIFKEIISLYYKYYNKFFITQLPISFAKLLLTSLQIALRLSISY